MTPSLRGVRTVTLRPEQGYPLRMLNPGWEGNTSVKWLRRLEIGDQPWHHREETSKYTDLVPDGRSRRFTYEQECNSVVISLPREAIDATWVC